MGRRPRWSFWGRSSRRGGGGRGGRVEDVVDKARSDGEFETGLVDVYTDNVGGALGAGECAGKEANGAGAEDEDRGAGGKGCAAGCMDDDA